MSYSNGGLEIAPFQQIVNKLDKAHIRPYLSPSDSSCSQHLSILSEATSPSNTDNIFGNPNDIAFKSGKIQIKQDRVDGQRNKDRQWYECVAELQGSRLSFYPPGIKRKQIPLTKPSFALELAQARIFIQDRYKSRNRSYLLLHLFNDNQYFLQAENADELTDWYKNIRKVLNGHTEHLSKEIEDLKILHPQPNSQDWIRSDNSFLSSNYFQSPPSDIAAPILSSVGHDLPDLTSVQAFKLNKHEEKSYSLDDRSVSQYFGDTDRRSVAPRFASPPCALIQDKDKYSQSSVFNYHESALTASDSDQFNIATGSLNHTDNNAVIYNDICLSSYISAEQNFPKESLQNLLEWSDDEDLDAIPVTQQSFMPEVDYCTVSLILDNDSSISSVFDSKSLCEMPLLGNGSAKDLEEFYKESRNSEDDDDNRALCTFASSHYTVENYFPSCSLSHNLPENIIPSHTMCMSDIHSFIPKDVDADSSAILGGNHSSLQFSAPNYHLLATINCCDSTIPVENPKKNNPCIPSASNLTPPLCSNNILMVTQSSVISPIERASENCSSYSPKKEKGVSSTSDCAITDLDLIDQRYVLDLSSSNDVLLPATDFIRSPVSSSTYKKDATVLPSISESIGKYRPPIKEAPKLIRQKTFEPADVNFDLVALRSRLKSTAVSTPIIDSEIRNVNLFSGHNEVSRNFTPNPIVVDSNCKSYNVSAGLNNETRNNISGDTNSFVHDHSNSPQVVSSLKELPKDIPALSFAVKEKNSPPFSCSTHLNNTKEEPKTENNDELGQVIAKMLLKRQKRLQEQSSFK